MTDWVIPCLLAGVAAAAMGRRTDVYGALTDGAAEGLRVLGRILPALVVLLSAVQMFRASGAMELLTGLLSPVLEGLGIPPETAVLLLVRPVSGSGALAVGSQLMEQYGPDSYIGRVTAVMLGCSETTFYTVAVYYGAAGIRRTRTPSPRRWRRMRRPSSPPHGRCGCSFRKAGSPGGGAEKRRLGTRSPQPPFVSRLFFRAYLPMGSQRCRASTGHAAADPRRRRPPGGTGAPRNGPSHR